jgi:hypothetical protein
VRVAQRFERGFAREVREVDAAAGERRQLHVAARHDGLGRGRDAAQAEPGRDAALVHHAFAAQRQVLLVAHDREPEVTRVLERAAHDGGAHDRPAVVRRAAGARRLER